MAQSIDEDSTEVLVNAAASPLCSYQSSFLDWDTHWDTNLVSVLANKTTTLLSARLTTAERQALHAKNFNSLPIEARAVYLHTVGYDVGFAVVSGGQLATYETLVRHLQTVPSIYAAPAVPAAYTQLAKARLTIAMAALQELNLLIAGQVTNSIRLQDAMRAGVINSFWNGTDWAF